MTKKKYIFTKYITIKGKKINAADYGLKAFRIKVN